jgi:hypothetical protein
LLDRKNMPADMVKKLKSIVSETESEKK